MGRTVDEKLKYNKDNKSDFASGYRIGVSIYRDYPKLGEKDRQQTKQIIDGYKDLARSGNELSKGFMCGIRDAANERKARQQKK